MTKKRKYDSVPRELPRFDSEKSFRLALAVLREAGVPFALAGRLAVWQYVPPEGQQFTKDVDLAIRYADSDRLGEAIRKSGHEMVELSIGGFGVRAEGASVEFIHGHPHFAALFADSIGAARSGSVELRVFSQTVPVVPRDYLIAAKLTRCGPGDERDVQELLVAVPERRYPSVQELVQKYLGYASVQYLDRIAREMGHPGPGLLLRYRDREDCAVRRDGG